MTGSTVRFVFSCLGFWDYPARVIRSLDWFVVVVVADGVYKAGFAKSQEAYQDAVVPLFESLDRVEAMLKNKTYLVGDQLTEADIRLYVSIVSNRSPNAPGRLVV